MTSLGSLTLLRRSISRVLKRGNIASLDALRHRILAFIAYFNQTAPPFRWTYRGHPLCR